MLSHCLLCSLLPGLKGFRLRMQCHWVGPALHVLTRCIRHTWANARFHQTTACDSSRIMASHRLLNV